jgi:dTDP-4-amino-4,6-dideoxygalactose transaminase
VIRSGKRDYLQNQLKIKEIESGIHYPIALPKLNAFRYLGQFSEPMFANRSDGDLLSIPISDSIAFTEAEAILDAIRQIA